MMGTLRGFPNPPATGSNEQSSFSPTRSSMGTPTMETRRARRTVPSRVGVQAARSVERLDSHAPRRLNATKRWSCWLEPRPAPRAERVCSSFARSLATAGLFAIAVGVLAGGCATAPPPITKIVNGRVVQTRAVSPEAYEHVARAHLYEEEERWQEAADELQRALPFDPEAAEVRAELAEIFIRLGRTDDAADEIARSLATAASVPGYLAEAHLAEAQAAQAPGAKSNPIPALEQAARLALGDEDAEAIETTHLELAEAEVGALDLSGALGTVRQLVRAAPDTQRGRVQLAALAWPLDALDEAVAAVTSAIDDEPADVEGRVLLGELQIATNHPAAAKASFKDAIDRAEAPLEIGDAFAGWLVGSGDLAGAQELADLLTADLPDSESLELAAALERTVKRPVRALALAERARQLGAGPGRVALMVGAAQAEEENWTGALKTYLAVAKTDPDFFESRLRAAEIERDHGKIERAGAALDEAASVQIDGTRLCDLAIARSQVDEKRGDAARAARELDEALVSKADDQKLDEGLEDRLILARAAVDERRGDWQRSVGRVDALLLREPRNVEALNFAGFIAADHGHELPLAIKRLQAAVALSPGAGGVVDSLGWAYFRAGDVTRADTFLEQAGRLEPGDPEILSHLGDLYARRQERERALATYRLALTLSPSDRVARELAERIQTLGAKNAAGR
jgi:tetratricopeptide (TPR) repeat protein